MSLKLKDKFQPERDLRITHLSAEAKADPITQRKSECRQRRDEGQGQSNLRESVKWPWDRRGLGRKWSGTGLHWKIFYVKDDW